MRIIVDAMGSDRAPGPEVGGAVRAVIAEPALEVTLVGDAEALDRALETALAEAEASEDANRRISIVHGARS
jgi:fatty acid/phospholipid biosynthesis enzyme